MYCPQCGTESQASLQYCRACGANLKVIGKAVALSEAIARSDRGPLPKIKEMVKSLKVDHVTDEVSRALDGMSSELAQISPERESAKNKAPWISFGRKKTALERREDRITKGLVAMLSGVGMTTFLYYLSAALVLKLPPHIVAQIPFEIDPVVRIIWLLGLIPTLSGVGNIIGGLLIRPQRHAPAQIEFPPPQESREALPTRQGPVSVTERTTNLLEREGSRT